MFGRRKDEADNEAVTGKDLFDNGYFKLANLQSWWTGYSMRTGEVLALVVLNKLLRVAQFRAGANPAARLLPQALGVGPCPRLEDLKPLQQRGSFLGIVLAAGIVAELQPSLGDSGFREICSVREREDAVLAVGAGGDLVQDLELHYPAYKLAAEEVARFECELLVKSAPARLSSMRRPTSN